MTTRSQGSNTKTCALAALLGLLSTALATPAEARELNRAELVVSAQVVPSCTLTDTENSLDLRGNSGIELRCRNGWQAQVQRSEVRTVRVLESKARVIVTTVLF